MRLFILMRNEDETGISGTGTVAEGIEFSDGKIAMRWVVNNSRSTTVFDNIEDVITIHGHNGKTQVIWK